MADPGDLQKDNGGGSTGGRDSKKPDKPKKLPPGKQSSTDYYGEGGPQLKQNNGVPGKATNTDGLAAGANGDQQQDPAALAPGKATNVDPNEVKPGANAKGGDEKKDAKGDGKDGGGGGGDAKQADHKDEGKDAGGAGGAKGAAGPKGAKGLAGATADGKGDKAAKALKVDAASGKGKTDAGAGYQGKPTLMPDKVDTAAPSAIPQFNLDAPKQNKNLADQWLKETGRTPQDHFTDIQAQLAQFQADVQKTQDDLIKAGNDAAMQATGEITQKVDAFKSSTVAQGKERVNRAYDGITTSFEQAEQKALAEIAKSKQTGLTQITQAGTQNASSSKQKFTAAKEEVNKVVQKNTTGAANALKAFATRVGPWIADGKERAKKGAKAAADSIKMPGSSAASLAAAEPALVADVQKSHALKHGQKLGTQYEMSLTGMTKEVPKRAEEVTRLALKDATIEFTEALKAADDDSQAGLKKATTDATNSLNTGEEAAKKAVGDARTNGVKKFDTEKASSLETADKAGKEFADTTTAATTELTDKIKKKAADDSKVYATVASDLEKQLKKGGPHKAEDVKERIAKAKEGLAKTHQGNLEGLKTLAEGGKGELQKTLTKLQDTYNKAITDREDAAKTLRGDVLKDITKAGTDFGTSLTTIASGFQKLATDETNKIEFARKEFLANADKSTADFEKTITAHLEQQQASLELSLNGNVAVDKIKADIEDPSREEAVQKKKTLGKDAAGLRDAFDGWGTGESKIFGIMRKCGPGEIVYLEAVYNDHYNWRGKGSGMTPLRYDIDDEMSGTDKKIAMAYLNGQKAEAIKLELADSTGFWNDDEARIEEVLRSCSDEEIKFLNSDPKAQAVVKNVKNALGGADLDVMNTLLDQKLDIETRQSKASAVRLFDAMDGAGTNEAKMKEIFEAAATDEERFRLRQQFNQYATAKGEKGGDGGAQGENDDALARMIKGDTEDGERAMMLEYAKVDRKNSDLKLAKIYEGADGGGTNEAQIFEALDDEDYNKRWKELNEKAEKGDQAAKQELKALEEQRKAIMDKKLDKMSGGEFKSIQGLIDGEMTKSNVTYGEFLAGKRENGTPLTAEEKNSVKNGDNLEWMVAQRKLQTGAAEPELMLAYACWGVSGTDEDTIKKVLSDGGEPKKRGDLLAIKTKFNTVWGRQLWTGDELATLDFERFPAPGGVLDDELSGKDWNDIRVLLCGKPETAEQLRYVTKLKEKRATSGLLGGTIMSVGQAIGATDAKETMEKSSERFDLFYQENFAKNPKAALGTADTARLEQLAEYLQQDIEAYSTTLAAIVDACVTAIEIIGGIIITVVTAGTASPVLAAIIANLALSAGTMVFKKLAIGDDYGGAEAMQDAIAAAGNAAFAGMGELKAIGNFSDKIAKGLTPRALGLIEKGAAKGGFKIAGNALKFAPETVEAVTKRVSAGVKNVVMSTGQQIYNTVTNEKTYEKKVGEALWGEGSLAMQILKGAPQAFAQGYVTQWINEGAGVGNKDNAGKIPGPVRNAVFNGLAEMGGTTAGFFVYLDNWQDGEIQWMELLKANAKSGISGTFQGYALHKTRAKRSGREYINGELNGESLDQLIKSMDDREKRDFVAFIEKYDHAKKAPPLPDSLKTFSTKPAANTNTNTNNTTNNTTNNGGGETTTPATNETKKKTDGTETTTDGNTTESKDKKKPVTTTDDEQTTQNGDKKKPANTNEATDENKDGNQPPVKKPDETVPAAEDQTGEKKPPVKKPDESEGNETEGENKTPKKKLTPAEEEAQRLAAAEKKKLADEQKARDDEAQRLKAIDDENQRLAAERAQEAERAKAKAEKDQQDKDKTSTDKEEAAPEGEQTGPKSKKEKPKSTTDEEVLDPEKAKAAALKKQQEEEMWGDKEAAERRKQKQVDDELKRDLEMREDDLRRQWGEDEDFESSSDEQKSKSDKRRDKRRNKDESEEKETAEREGIEDAREELAEGDRKRKDKKADRQQAKKDKARLEELVDLATQAHAEYGAQLEAAKALLQQITGDLGEVQGRAKDPESAANRLQRAEKNFGAKITDVQSAKDNIWDALGTRVVVTGSPDEIKQILKNVALAAKAGKLEIVKGASNHGDGVAPYLTQADLDGLGMATAGKADTAGGVKTAKSDQSAFTSGLIFVKYPDGTRGEIQIIGKKVLEVAAIEHIPYDISIGKPLARGMDEKNLAAVKSVTEPVEAAMKQLAKDPTKKAEYEQYMRDLYKHARDAELGIESPKPKLPAGIDDVLSADGLKKVYDEIEGIKAKAKAEKAKGEGPPTADDKDKPPPAKKDDDENDPKTRSEDGKQTEKPDMESAEQAKERRSKPLRPSNELANADTWAEPQNRQNVPDHVPLTRQELRDTIMQRYGEFLNPFLGNVSNRGLKSNDDGEIRHGYLKLQEEFKKLIAEHGPGKVPPAEAQKLLDQWTEVGKKNPNDAQEGKLRTLYGLVEQEDFPQWYDHVRHLPKEQQAKLGHMWREEWKIFVRDMMSDPDSKEVLYLRDLAVSGDRRGARFDDFMAKNKAKGLTDDQAMEAIIASSMTSNPEVNKKLNAKNGDTIAEIKGSRVQNDDDRKAELDALATQMRSQDETIKAKAAADYEALKNNPDYAVALEKHKLSSELFATFKANDPHAKGYKANMDDITQMSDHIPELLAQQDKARLGSDPVMQAKRDRFERAVALAMLDPKGPVAEKIDAELSRMCDKALDYISRMKDGRQSKQKAIGSLGTDSKKGYGGGVGSEYEVVMDVLKNGNIRERMLALANFGEMLAKDGLTKKGREKLEDRAEGHAAGDHYDKQFNAEDAQRIIDRLKKYDESMKPGDKPDHKALLKPIGDEKSGDHKDYADAKAQNMDTKMPELLAEKVNAHLKRKAKEGEGTLVDGAEKSPLARTQKTVREAMAEGLQLSDREIAAAGGLDAPLDWVIGLRANMVDPNAKFIAEAKAQSMPLKAGISGTTFRWMLVVDLLGGNPEIARLAAVASLQAADAHSYHEIATAAKGFGASYDKNKPYDNMGLDRAFLEELAKSQGTSLEELQDFRTPEEKKKKKAS